MITYISLVRKQYGSAVIDGQTRPLYHYVPGPELTGEVWSYGPLRGTVWVLDPSAPGGARAVDIATMREVEYRAPAMPGPRRFTFEDNRRAEKILWAQREYDRWTERVRQSARWYSPSPGPRPDRPSPDELAWAQDAHTTWEAEAKCAEFFREASHAPRPIRVGDFRRLTMATMQVEPAKCAA